MIRRCSWGSGDGIAVAVVDRYSGAGKVSKMFWRNVGPITPNSALASSQMHDIHNIWVLGNDDGAMAMAANAVADMQGGWALVRMESSYRRFLWILPA